MSRHTPVDHGDPDGHPSPAGVLALLHGDDDPAVVLTRRSPHLRSHTHEVAFPGGRREPGDPDLWHTALREASEEVALDPGLVERVGRLDAFETVGSRSMIVPFVAVARRRPRLTANPAEVEAIRHVPLRVLLDDTVWREEIWPLRGTDRAITFFELDGDTVWGATAAMLRQLLSLVTGVDPRITGGPA